MLNVCPMHIYRDTYFYNFRCHQIAQTIEPFNVYLKIACFLVFGCAIAAMMIVILSIKYCIGLFSAAAFWPVGMLMTGRIDITTATATIICVFIFFLHFITIIIQMDQMMIGVIFGKCLYQLFRSNMR